MRYLITILCLLLSPAISHSTVIFQFTGESGYQYMGSANAHPGGGYFSSMGGAVAKPAGVYDAGSCAADTTNYHFSVLDNTTPAQGASSGSQYSLKTPYLGVCPNQSYSRDTTIITTPLLTEYWVQWKQKWTGNFQASVQQKFAKFYNSADTLERTMSGYFIMEPQNTPETTSGRFVGYFNNIEGYLNQECGGLSSAQTRIASVAPCSEPNHTYDNSATTTSDIFFETDRWYTITMHSKLNSAAETADAVFEVWVDGVLRLSQTNFKMRDFVTYNSPGTDRFEFQHVYYDRSNVDQTTYMDDIIISDSAIGDLDVAAPVTSHNGSNRSATAQAIALSVDETATTTYCLDAATCTPTLTYTAPVSVKPGKFMCYRSTDSASNQEATKCQYFGWPIKCQ